MRKILANIVDMRLPVSCSIGVCCWLLPLFFVCRRRSGSLSQGEIVKRAQTVSVRLTRIQLSDCKLSLSLIHSLGCSLVRLAISLYVDSCIAIVLALDSVSFHVCVFVSKLKSRTNTISSISLCHTRCN